MKKRKCKINTKKTKAFLCIFIIVLFILAFIITIFFINKNNYVIDSRIKNVQKLKDKNDLFIRGWLKVEGTDIDYPVIQRSAFEPDYLYVWTNTDSKKLEDTLEIFGHNILNVSNKPLIRNKNHTGFEQLAAFIYYDVAKENQFIQYTIDEKDYIYKIYAVTFDDINEDHSFETLKEKKEYIKKVKKNSLFTYDIEVNENDKLITLKTCTRMFGGHNTNIQIKVEGRLMRKRESKKHYKVNVSKDYDKILGGAYL